MRGIDRRRFLRAASAVAGAGMSGMAMAQGADGRAAITKADQEALARQRQGGTLTCVKTPESIDGLQRTLTVGETFCRGHQVTDDSGYVEFDTIVPGWEFVETPAPPGVARRTTHIHVKVFSDFKVTTTQLYFPDEYMNELYAGVQPYTANRSMEAPVSGRRYERITNAEDREFLSSQSRPMSLERIADGIVATATIGLVTLGTRRLQTLFR